MTLPSSPGPSDGTPAGGAVGRMQVSFFGPGRSFIGVVRRSNGVPFDRDHRVTRAHLRTIG